MLKPVSPSLNSPWSISPNFSHEEVYQEEESETLGKIYNDARPRHRSYQSETVSPILV